MKKFSGLAISCLAALSMTYTAAEPIFTWVDREGVTHFSETPPEDAAVEPFRIELGQAPAAGPVRGDDYYSVVKQVERMQKSRLENEKARTERLQAEAEARRAATANQPRSTDSNNDTNRYYPSYPLYGYRPGYKPGHPPGNKPGHRPGNKPGHRPGHRPVHPIQLPEYSGHGGYRGRTISRVR